MRTDEAQWPLEEPHRRLIELVRKAADVMHQGAGAKKIKLKNTHAGWVCAIHGTRCCRNLRAVAMLCESGQATEATHIVRAMLEDAVTIAHIREDQDGRGKQYVDFEETRAYRYMKDALRGGYLDPKSKRAQELTEKYGDSEELDTQWWAGLGPAAMAGKLSKTRNRALRSDFFGLYPLLSDDAHGNAMSARNYAVQDEDGNPVGFVDTQTPYRVDEVTSLAIYCAWRLAEAPERETGDPSD